MDFIELESRTIHKHVLVFVRNGLDLDELEEQDCLCEAGGKYECQSPKRLRRLL